MHRDSVGLRQREKVGERIPYLASIIQEKQQFLRHRINILDGTKIPVEDL
jgi:hypothetical protein